MNQKDQFNKQYMPRNKYNKILLSIFFLVLILSSIKPHDYFTWFLEVLPALIGIVVIWYLKKYHKFEFTRLVLFWLLVHSIVLMIGAHWTYAEVPFFNWLRDIGLFSRNNYDKVGHFMQGFVPFLVAREVLIRETPLTAQPGSIFFRSVLSKPPAPFMNCSNGWFPSCPEVPGIHSWGPRGIYGIRNQICSSVS